MITINRASSADVAHRLKEINLKTGNGDVFLGEVSEHKSEWIFMDYIVEPYTTFTIENEEEITKMVRDYYNSHLFDLMELSINKLRKDL